MEKIINRFWKKVTKTDTCWFFGTPTRANRYGSMSLGDGNRIGAHRFSYLIQKGEIPNGLCVCHTCDNTRCINPDHLFLGTMKDNMQDKLKKGRHKPHIKRKTHCKRGHERTDNNLYISPNGRIRTCKICVKELRLEKQK